MLSIGKEAGSVQVLVEQKNGWHYNGTFYLGDTVSFESYHVKIAQINLDRDSPVLFEYYKTTDAKNIFLIGLILVAIYNIYSARPNEENE